MRYNHGYHQRLHGSRHHRRLRLASFVLLAVLIAVLTLAAHTPLDLHTLLTGFGLSLYRVVLGYAASLFLALVLGLLTVSRPALEALFLPILDVAQSFPSFALLPILVFYFGKNSLSVVVILVVEMIWPILFNVISGVKEQRQDQAEAAAVFGAKGWRYLWYYRLPMLMPALITGSIVSWGEAWDTIVGAEIIAGVVGAGHYLGTISQAGQAPLLFLGIAVYLLLIFSLNQVIWLPLLHHYTKYQAES